MSSLRPAPSSKNTAQQEREGVRSHFAGRPHPRADGRKRRGKEYARSDPCGRCCADIRNHRITEKPRDVWRRFGRHRRRRRADLPAVKLVSESHSPGKSVCLRNGGVAWDRRTSERAATTPGAADVEWISTLIVSLDQPVASLSLGEKQLLRDCPRSRAGSQAAGLLDEPTAGAQSGRHQSAVCGTPPARVGGRWYPLY